MPARKKLLIITDLYPNRYNPIAGIFVQQQAKELACYYQIQVVAACDKNPYFIYQHHQDGFATQIICYPYWQKFFLSSLITYRILAVPIIKRCYKRFQPDLVHIHDYRHIPELFWLKPWLDKLTVPKYLTLHNIRTHPALLKNNPRISFYKWALGRTLTRWNHIFTVNSRLAEWVKPYNQKVTVIGNGITEPIAVEPVLVDNFKKNIYDDFCKIISIGNLVTEKGFVYLIEAVSILKKEGFLIQLFIVGEGEKRQDIEQKVKSCDLTNEVTLPGRIDNALLRNILPLFDLFVLPSYSETFGIVFLEAMYAGLPVIGIINEGIYDIAEDGVEALFTNPQSSSELALKIKKLIQNPVLRNNIAKAGQKLVQEKYMLNELIQRVIEVYERR